jgi:hypothetical protein
MAGLCPGVNSRTTNETVDIIGHHLIRKRDVLDVHVYNIMAINSADIVSYTASSEGAVRLIDGKTTRRTV